MAAWIGTSVLLAKFGEQELVVSCPLRAIHTTPRDGDEMRVPLIERSVFE
jgi:hypothetical protein